MAGYIDGLKLINGVYHYRLMIRGIIKTGSTGCTRLFEALEWLLNFKVTELRKLRGEIKPDAPTLRDALATYRINRKGRVTDERITKVTRSIEARFTPLLDRRLDTIIMDEWTACFSSYIERNKCNESGNFGGYNQLRINLLSVIGDGYPIPGTQRSQERARKVLRMEDVTRILEWIDKTYGFQSGCAVRLGVYLGLRSVEVSRATWNCLEGNRWTNSKTKGKEATTLPCPPELVEALTRLRAIHKLRDMGEDISPVMPTQDGSHHGDYTQIAKYWLEKAGLELLGYRVTTHTLRSAYITHLHSKGVRIKVIQRLARHAKIQTTMNYIRIDEADMEDAVGLAFGS